MTWRIIPYRVADPARNMAIDEAIFSCYLKKKIPPTLRFYGWDPPSLSVGYFQEIEKEINIENLSRYGFGLVRRNTGGRAVLHHHELTYSIVAGVQDGVPEGLTDSYLYISKALAGAFQGLGISADLFTGSSAGNKRTGACFDAPSWYELTVNRQKLVGSAQLRRQDSFLQHGSILLKFSPEDLASVLKIQAVSMDKWVDSIKEKVTSFEDLGVIIRPIDLEEKIVNSFAQLYKLEFDMGDLIPEELELVEQLITTKYANDEWNLYRGKSCDQVQHII